MTDSPHPDGAIGTLTLSTRTDTRHRIRFPAGSGLASWALPELDRRAARGARRPHALGLRARDRSGVMARKRNRMGGAGPRRAQARLPSPRDSRRDAFDPAQIAKTCDLRPAEIYAIKFTSGSTGVPKGLEATVASVECSLAELQRLFLHRDGDDALVFLRLALLQQRYWIRSALVNGHDVTISDLDHAAATAQAAAPTVGMGVPRFHEALRARLLFRQTGLEADQAARGAIQSVHLKF